MAFDFSRKIAISILGVLIVVLANLGTAGERTDSLRDTLAGADRVVISNSVYLSEERKLPNFEFAKEPQIASLIEILDFDDSASGFHCMCLGDCQIDFYQGKNHLATLTHHHGLSLRWIDGNWEGDSQFSPESAEAWRHWFEEHGEPRFEKHHQAMVQSANEEREVYEKFFSHFPEEARKVFDRWEKFGWLGTPDVRDTGGIQEEKFINELVATFPDQATANLAIVRSLGSLSASSDTHGSWSSTSAADGLALECAQVLDGKQFRMLAEQTDALVLLGSARLFFFENHSELIPAEDRGKVAARLAEVTLLHDRSGNIEIVLNELRRFDCQEVNSLLERIASGKITAISEPRDRERDPQSKVTAVLILASREFPGVEEMVKSLEQLPDLTAVDQGALRIARSFLGETRLLSREIFALNSAVSLEAVEALEAEGGNAALGAIIEGAVGSDRSAFIREQGIRAVERMTGLKWSKRDEELSAEEQAIPEFRRTLAYAEQILKWWEDNKDSYRLPE